MHHPTSTGYTVFIGMLPICKRLKCLLCGRGVPLSRLSDSTESLGPLHVLFTGHSHIPEQFWFDVSHC